MKDKVPIILKHNALKEKLEIKEISRESGEAI